MISFFLISWLEWINQVYLRANHARLKAAHTYVTDELKTLGVPFLNRNAGFFVWIDFRKVGLLGKEASPGLRAASWCSFVQGKVQYCDKLFVKAPSVVWWAEGRVAWYFCACFSFFSACTFPSLQESYCSQATLLSVSSFLSQLLYFRGKRYLPGLCRPHGNHRWWGSLWISLQVTNLWPFWWLS